MSTPPLHRVAVTGLGCISALGHSVPQVWDALINARSGIAEVAESPIKKLHIKIAAEVKDYDEAEKFNEQDILVLDRYSQFAVLTAAEAIKDAGIDFEKDGLGRETAVIFASGIGGWQTIDASFMRLYRDNLPRVHPFTIPRMMISAATSQISMRHGLTGPAFCVSSACSSSNHAIGEAYWMVRTGRARAAISGGSEASITLTAQRSWESLRVMAPDTCRPFSKGRKGMVLGEGAATLVLERWDDAVARGADIYAEMVGYGLSADAGDLVMPSQEGASRAIRQAVETGGLNPEEITYINAHGTGTVLNDKTETAAIKDVLGAASEKVMVTSTKSMHGHALGGAGALEAVATLKAIKTGIVPPTANYVEPDPDCDLDYVPNEAREAKITAALSDTLAFGGLNAVLAWRAAS